MTTDVSVTKLAVELNVTVPRLLQVADDVIERIAVEHGLDAARGLSTRPGPAGTVLLTAPLAERVRTYFTN